MDSVTDGNAVLDYCFCIELLCLCGFQLRVTAANYSLLDCCFFVHFALI